MNLYRGFRQCSSLFKVILPFLLRQKQKNIQNFANKTFYAIHHDKNILNSCKNLSAWILLSVPIPKKGFEVGLIISYSFFVNIPSISMHDSERRHAFHRNYIENHEVSPNIKDKHLILENSKNSIRTFLSRKSNVRKLPILTCRPKNRVRTT